MANLRIPIAKLKADPRNPRQISEDALRGLGVSMETFGDLSGITFNEKLGVLVCGHQRIKKLKKTGSTEVVRDGKDAGHIVDKKTGERFPVRFVKWDETKHRMAEIVANNPEIQGDYTEEALDQLRSLEAEAGFADMELDQLVKDLQAEFAKAEEDVVNSGKTDPDAAVEPPKNPITKEGDLWVLGDHRLLCGSATEDQDAARLMDGKKATLMATDPPYGVDYTAVKAGMPVAGLGDAQERWGDIANDNLKDGELEGFLLKMFAASAPHLVKKHAVYVWHPSGELNHVFRAAMRQSKYLVHRQIVWAKPGFVLTRSGMYHWAHETCFYGWREGDVPPWYGEKNQTSVWQIGRDDGKAVHPTQKPVEIFERPMHNHTRKGEICLEPFSGSGSQIIAGERLGRKVFALELSPRWCDAAVQRWEEFTGKKARRADGKLKAAEAKAGD